MALRPVHRLDEPAKLSFSMVAPRSAASVSPGRIIVAPPRPSVSTSGSPVDMRAGPRLDHGLCPLDGRVRCHLDFRGTDTNSSGALARLPWAPHIQAPPSLANG